MVRIKLKKIIFWMISCFILLLLIMAFSIFYFSYDRENSDHIVLASPYGQVNIDIDKHAIPHIKSPSYLGAFYALGYMHAKNRLWQMEFQRLVAKGALSEVFGKYTLEQDKYLRTWGFYQAAKNDWRYFNDNTKAVIKSYTAGVNTYIARGILPIECALLLHKPERWSLYDSYAWGKVIAWQQENIWQDKIINYLLREKFNSADVLTITKDYPSSAPTTLSAHELHQAKNKINNNSSKQTVMFAPKQMKQLYSLLMKNKKFAEYLNIKIMPGKGSNAWVLAGSLTSSGKPILANDVHLELTSPGIWYVAELQAPNLHVIGATLPGSPAVLIGHNDSIAWGITDAGVDAQDVYFLPSDAKMFVRNELINVRGHYQPTKFQVKISEFGPIITSLLDNKNFSSKNNVAVKWTALIPGDTTIQSFLKVNTANNWHDFSDALKDFVSPPLNFLYADKKGNIGYYLPGKIPLRKSWSGRYPIIADDNHHWSGYIPFTELPHVLNPEKGYIVSANNKPIPNEYPYRLTYHWREMPYRAQRIIEVITSGEKNSINSAIKLQLDIKSNLWENLKKELLLVKPLNPGSSAALKLLQNWNGLMDEHDITPTIFASWCEEIKAIQPKFATYLLQLSNPIFILDQLQNNGQFIQQQGYISNSDFLSKTLFLAINKLEMNLGKDKKNWQWGNVHHANFKGMMFGEIKFIGQLWNRKVSTSGGGYTVNLGAYDKNFNQIGGAMYRQVIDLSDDQNSYFITATGQSGNIFSKHYADLLNLWVKGKYIHEKRSMTNRLPL